MTKPPLGISARCIVTNTVDGDTLDVELRIPARIRLLDCWAPESRTLDLAEKKLGIKAKQAMEQLTAGGHGQVFIPSGSAHSIKDIITLDRLLGRVWMDGNDFDLSTEQVAMGNASTTKNGKLGE